MNIKKFQKGLIKSNKTLKKYLILERGESCEECNTGCLWNGQFLNLQVDHMDGNNKNNFPSNLRLLCPNCHSQTLNFCGGNIKMSKALKNCKL